jgi:head-tail adaptor
MVRTVTKPDAGKYNRPAQIQAPAAYVDNGQGGNSNADVWTTVRSPMIQLESRVFGRGLHRTFQYGQLYPDASHWAELHYANDTAIDATMRLVIDSRVFQIIGAEDVNLEHVTTLLALVEYQAKGSK